VEPTAVRFASDGRVFVAEKRGVIKVFANISSTTPAVFADLNANVYNFWDRGLLGLALHPNFPATPYVYVLYTYDFDPSQANSRPRWGTPGVYNDPCPTPPGATDDGCVVSGRLSRLTAAGDVMTGTEQVLIEDWCQQYPSHSIGAILRVDPLTGAGLSDNPLAGSADPNARRIIAHGFRNPFRLTVRPGTNDIWIGDVGWNTREEIDRIPNPTAPAAMNFGWPCYEGAGRQSGYDAANLTLCENLYAETGAVIAPVFAYNHADKVVANETCPTGSSSITGLAFYGSGSYPSAYTGALFFADYSRDCIWVMFRGSNGLPDPSQRQTLVAGAANPVFPEIGPNGGLFYVDLGGSVRRITYFSGNQPPTASMTATPTSGAAPLTVTFDGRGSSDPDPGDHLTFSWDFNGDGVFGDATIACCPTFTYTNPGSYSASLRVTDQSGEAATASTTITANNTPPTPVILAPASATTWKVGDTITFSGSATDAQEGALPASALTWTLTLFHCPSNCHTHPLQTFVGVSGGSFVTPDHECPSYFELKLTAVDSTGLQGTTTVRLDPRTVVLSFQTVDAKLQLTVNSTTRKAPFTVTVIVGSRNTISAATPQFIGSNQYEFVSWSDRGAPTHDIIAGASAATLMATYRKVAKR
jgi:PKD domain/Glucose / Sorbosone dehydrogenase